MVSTGKVDRVVRSPSEDRSIPQNVLRKSTILFQLLSQLAFVGLPDGRLWLQGEKEGRPPATMEEQLTPHTHEELLVAVRDVNWEAVASEEQLRAITTCLSNGMQVAIVESGEELNEATFDLNIGVGTARDPIGRPGLIELSAECVVSAIKELLDIRSSDELPILSLCWDAVVSKSNTSVSLRVKLHELAKASQQFVNVVQNPDLYITSDMVTTVLKEIHSRWKFANSNFTLAADRLMNDPKNQGFRGSSALLKGKYVEELRDLVVDTVRKWFTAGNTRTVLIGGPETTEVLKHAAHPLVGVPVGDASPVVFVDQQPEVENGGSLTRVMPRESDEKLLSFRFPMGSNPFSQKDRAFAWFVARLFTDTDCGSLSAELKQGGFADLLTCRVCETGCRPELVVDMRLDSAKVSDEVLQKIGQIIYTHIGTLRETRNFEALLGDVATKDAKNRRAFRLGVSWDKGSSFKEVLEADGVKNDEEAIVEISRLLERIGNSGRVRVMVVDSDYMPGTGEELDAVEDVPELDVDVLRQRLPETWKTSWVPLAVPSAGVKWKAALVEKPQSMEGFAVNFLRLQNDLNLVLVSAPDARRFAVSSTVRAGNTSAPVEYPGLPHLVEHVLPDSSPDSADCSTETPNFSIAASKAGSSSNAFTTPNSTTYHAEAELDEADKILASAASMLANPLLSKDTVEAELAAIDSEWDVGSKRDTFRNKDVLSLLGNPNHVMQRVLTGNERVLLNLDRFDCRENALEALRDAATSFFRTHYSANITTVVVVARSPIRELEKMTVERFSKMPNRNVVPLEGSGKWTNDTALYRPGKELNQLITVPSTSPPWNVLQFFWRVNDQFDYRSTPLWLVGWFLTQTCEGSLSSLLKERRLAKYIGCGGIPSGYGPNLCSIRVTLEDDVEPTTELVAEIGQLICTYLRLLKESGVPQWMIDEEWDTSQNRWLYGGRVSEGGIASRSGCVGRYPLEDIFSMGPKIERHEVLTEMEPFADVNNLLILSNRKVANEELQTFEFDPRSTFKFKREPMPKNVLEKCAAVWNLEKDEFWRFAQDLGLTLPPRNPFVASNLKVKTGGAQGERKDPTNFAPKVVPGIVVPGIKVWHKQVTFANSPKIFLQVVMRVPSLLPKLESLCELKGGQGFQKFLNDEKAKLAANCDFADLAPTTKTLFMQAFIAALDHWIESVLHQADESGLSGRITSSIRGAHPTINLSIAGFDEKAGQLLEILLETLVSPKLEENHIRQAIDELKTSSEFILESSNPLVKCACLRTLCLAPGLLSLEENVPMADLLDVHSVKRFFTPDKIKTLFSGACAEAVVIGNVTEDEAREFFNSERTSALWKQLAPTPGDMLEDQILAVNLPQLKKVIFHGPATSPPSLPLPVRGLLVRQKDPKTNDENNCGVSVSLVTIDSPESDVLLELLEAAFKTDFREDLRTRQNLGYDVGISNSDLGPYRLLNFSVRSNRDSATVLAKIVEFLNREIYDCEKHEVKLQMTEEEFQEMKKLALSVLGSKFMSLWELAASYRNHLNKNRLEFDNIRKRLTYLEGLTLDKLKNEVKDLMMDLPIIASCVYPASEKTEETEFVKPSMVDWYNVEDHRDLTLKHFDETTLRIPFL